MSDQNIQGMITALTLADTGNVFTVEGTSVTAMVGDRSADVDIIKKGTLKYRLSGSLFDYNNAWYTKPTSLIKRVAIAQSVYAAEQQRVAIELKLTNDALDEMVRRYPDCEVTVDQKWSRRHRTEGIVDAIKVETGNGYILFNYRRTDGEIVFDVRYRNITNEAINTQLDEMIIGKANVAHPQ